jgi:hypothetical protein
MTPPQVVPIFGMSSAAALRREISERAQKYAGSVCAPYCLSYSECPSVCFEAYADGTTHGNFLDRSYRSILRHPAWVKRLKKVHTHSRKSLPGDRAELDSCNSSDALLMNIFCYPAVLNGPLKGLLGITEPAEPEFGYRARVPLVNGKLDRTEVDVRIGDLLIEAKLTENDFQTAPVPTMDRYLHFRDVFEVDDLDRKPSGWASYQLLRNVLAAHSAGCSFCVLLDERRPELREAWYRVMRCVRHENLRVRCKVLTWQEIARVLPLKLKRFLKVKYGITGLN